MTQRILHRRPGLHFLMWRSGLASANTQTTAREQACLQKHAAGKRRLIEIGVWHGVNTRKLRAVMASDGILFAVDPFPPCRFGFSWQRWIARGEVGRERNGEVCFLEMTSAKAAEEFHQICGDPLDFAFIDGEHSFEGLQTDWTLWSARMAAGGIIALHDSRTYPGREIDHVGSVRFTKERVLLDSDYEVIDEQDSLTVLQRRAGVDGNLT